MIGRTMLDMVGRPYIQPQPHRDAMRKAFKDYKRMIDTTWYNPKNLYAAVQTRSGQRLIKFTIGLL